MVHPLHGVDLMRRASADNLHGSADSPLKQNLVKFHTFAWLMT